MVFSALLSSALAEHPRDDRLPKQHCAPFGLCRQRTHRRTAARALGYARPRLTHLRSIRAASYWGLTLAFTPLSPRAREGPASSGGWARAPPPAPIFAPRINNSKPPRVVGTKPNTWLDQPVSSAVHCLSSIYR